MPQGKLKTKIKKPCDPKSKSNLVKKKESLTKRGSKLKDGSCISY